MKKTILVTGASTGIGRATAKIFQEKGWNVIATMRSPENEQELNKLENVLVSRLDVLDLESIDSSIAQGIEKFGKIDIVVNNAGYALVGTFESASRESVVRQFAVNVQGLFDVTQKMLPHFRKNKEGMFINLSSIGGKVTFPFMAPYHSTKFAIEGFSESLHWELGDIGIKVKIIEPGGVATDFGTRSIDMQHNQEFTEYNEFLTHFMSNFVTDANEMSTSEYAAELIYKAATDGTDTLRYRIGADAEQILTARKNMSDEEFFGLIKTRFNID